MKLNKWWQSVLAFVAVTGAGAQTRTVWQIGKFDESPVEFSRGPEENVTFEVGKNNADTDWPERQTTGHAYRILFALESERGTTP